MINRLLDKQSSKQKPTTLKNCCFYVDLEPFEFEQTSIFFLGKQSISITIVGELMYQTFQKKTLAKNIGYLELKLNGIALRKLIQKGKAVSIFGYNNNLQYQLLDVSIQNGDAGFDYFCAQYSFTEFRLKRVK